MSGIEELKAVFNEKPRKKVSISAINTCAKRLCEYTKDLQDKSDNPEQFDMIIFWLEQMSKHIKNNS